MIKKLFAQYQQIMGAISYATFLLLIFTLPFPWAFTQPVCVAWGIAWLLECRWAQASNWRYSRGLIPQFLIAAMVAWCAASLLWTSNWEQGIHDLTKYIIVLSALIIGACGTNDNYKPASIKSAMMIGCLLSIVTYSMIMFSYNKVTQLHPSLIFFNPQPWCFFAEPPIGIIKHRLYYCIPLTLSIFFSGDLYQHYCKTRNRFTVLVTLGIADLILLTVIILTGSRTMMLLIPIMIILMIIRYTKGIKLIAALVLAILIGLLGCKYMLKHNTRIITTIEKNQNITEEDVRKRPLAYEPRIYLHSSVLRHSYQLSKKGFGIGTAQDFMLQTYEDEQLPEMVNKAYGPHSQYLNTWIELGPLAAIFLLLIVCIGPFFCKGPVRWDAIFIAVTFGWAMLTETALSRVSGMYLLAAMMILLAIEDREQMASHLGIRKSGGL